MLNTWFRVRWHTVALISEILVVNMPYSTRCDVLWYGIVVLWLVMWWCEGRSSLLTVGRAAGCGDERRGFGRCGSIGGLKVSCDNSPRRCVHMPLDFICTSWETQDFRCFSCQFRQTVVKVFLPQMLYFLIFLRILRYNYDTYWYLISLNIYVNNLKNYKRLNYRTLYIYIQLLLILM